MRTVRSLVIGALSLALLSSMSIVVLAQAEGGEAFTVEDDLELAIHGQVFGGKDNEKSPYHSWDDNDNIGVSLIYKF